MHLVLLQKYLPPTATITTFSADLPYFKWVSTVKMTTLTDKTPHANTNPSKMRTTTERGSNMLLNLWGNQQLKTTFSTRALLAVFGVTLYGSGMNALRSA